MRNGTRSVPFNHALPNRARSLRIPAFPSSQLRSFHRTTALACLRILKNPGRTFWQSSPSLFAVALSATPVMRMYPWRISPATQRRAARSYESARSANSSGKPHQELGNGRSDVPSHLHLPGHVSDLHDTPGDIALLACSAPVTLGLASQRAWPSPVSHDAGLFCVCRACFSV